MPICLGFDLAIAAYQLPTASGTAFHIAAGVMQRTDGCAAIVAESVPGKRHFGAANAWFPEAGTFGLRIVPQALIELSRDRDRRRDTAPAFDHPPSADLTRRRQCLSPCRRG